MSMDVRYKVLWVDDDESIVKGTKLEAENYDLELVHFTNWEDAEEALRKNFQDYSAVILDANCKIHRGGIEGEGFLTTAVVSLTQISGQAGQWLPWYLLSAGTMNSFNSIIEGVQYHHHSEEWGSMLYLKVTDDTETSLTKLFENIQRVARNAPANVVLHRHGDVFAYLGKDKLIQGEARSIMLTMLSALYFPTESKYFEYEGNPLRKVIEYMFWAAYRCGLLPQECIEGDDQINLLDSSRYMSGMETRHSHLRYGKEGDTIFPRHISDVTRHIINFGNKGSHITEENPYTIDDKDLTVGENEKELYFSYVLHLCYVIKWFGSFVKDHPDEEANKRMKKVVPQPGDSANTKRQGIIQMGGTGPYIKDCRLPNSPYFKKNVGKRAITVEPSKNTGEDSDKYPYFATRVTIEDNEIEGTNK